MDLTNPVMQLCIEGSRAEFEGRRDDARRLFERAWEISQDDYEACIAAHYVARFQVRPEDMLAWNQEVLRRADAVGDDRVTDFYPSLYVNLGYAYEQLGDSVQARRSYELAAELGIVHQPGGKGRRDKEMTDDKSTCS
ncbi:MAG: hypothetical protein HY868_13805 [Chloroflexi bacterium]|nr:hypothetical protein [Chloroflexota bacterium]